MKFVVDILGNAQMCSGIPGLVCKYKIFLNIKKKNKFKFVVDILGKAQMCSGFAGMMSKGCNKN